MSKRDGSNGPDPRRRLARLRKEAGYAQLEFARELDIAHHMIAYHEGETVRPPAALPSPTSLPPRVSLRTRPSESSRSST